MAGNVETLKSGYEAYGRGDIEGATEPWADDIRWEGTNSTQVPGGGTYQGKDRIIQNALEPIAEAWDENTVVPDEFIEQGDTVVVLGHTEARAKSTGRDVKVPFVHVWRFEGGKAKRVQLLTDTAVVLSAIEG